jgi:aryl-alcohol dehydrogenase-like predicted oxidoreductase
LKSAVAATVVVGASSQAWAAETKEGIPYRALGRTGVQVSAIGLGGYHIGKKELEEAESIRIIRSAIDRGITFMDNCWDYNDGASEIRMGKALRDGYRQKAFLMTKVDGRTKEAAASTTTRVHSRWVTSAMRRLRCERYAAWFLCC